LKAKTCKACGGEFTPQRTTQQACSYQCALAVAHKQRVLAEKRKTRKMLEEIKPLSQWMKDAQTVFNRYIRLRDANQPCICCGKHYTGQYHAGHYLSVGAHPELRFCEDNVHKQKSSCNSFKSGNQAQYRINLIKKIGLERVEWLEGPHSPARYRIEDAKEIIKIYKAKIKDLQ
jgi:hypothetical protein